MTKPTPFHEARYFCSTMEELAGKRCRLWSGLERP